MVVWSAGAGPYLSALVRVHAPDHIIAQLGGTFAPFTTMASVLGPHRITPPGTTWATAELYLWWSPPQLGGGSAAAYNENLAARSRRVG